MTRGSDCDLIIIGAGSAGIGAAKSAARHRLSFRVIEATHRIGGRAYTEELTPGVAFDLGCHWMHSASLNPYVEIADRYGFDYRKGTYPRGLFRNGHWANARERDERDDFIERCHLAANEAAAAGRDVAVSDVTEREHAFTALFDYFISLGASVDSDQLSLLDVSSYNDTEENWPLKQGFGALIARFGQDVPVTLNCAASTIEWGGEWVRVHTPKGTVSGRRVLLTVSTGILGAGDIRFVPELPAWKQEAIAALPLGVHNRICLQLEPHALPPDTPGGVTLMEDGAECMSFNLRPFGYEYVVGLTGGRFASWLERAGIEASVALATENLAKIFGSEVNKRIKGHKVTAWEGDPWVRGAYSAAKPGAHHQRAKLALDIEGKLFFAGEATSPEFFATAHGAYLSGVERVRAIAEG